MRKLPSFLATLFIALNIGRVAEFAGDRMKAGEVAGLIFSAGMAAGVFAVAYWTRVSGYRTITRKDRATGERVSRVEEVKESRAVRWVAWILVVVMVAADGFFNLIEVLLTVNPGPGDELTQYAAWIYGTFPTVAAAALGVLQGFIDKLPADGPARRKVGVKDALTGYVVRALGGGNLPEITEENFQPAALLTGHGGNFPETFQGGGEPSGKVPGDWRNLPESEKRQVASMSAAEIARIYGVSDRTARNWRKAAQGLISNGYHPEEVMAGAAD